MIDREKVIEGLEYLITAYAFHGDDAECLGDALQLLKEQGEAYEPVVSGTAEHDGHGSWWYQCGKCRMPIDHGDKFCRQCGQAVKWDG